MVSGSVALLADTVHDFSDALTALPLAMAFWLGRRPANRRYTYDYGRAEDLAGVFIVAMIALSAGVTAWEAVDRLLDPRTIDAPGWVALAGVIGFAGNELVAACCIRIGRRIGSARARRRRALRPHRRAAAPCPPSGRHPAPRQSS
jgi:cation diffusion facilitator family transporter